MPGRDSSMIKCSQVHEGLMMREREIEEVVELFTGGGKTAMA